MYTGQCDSLFILYGMIEGKSSVICTFGHTQQSRCPVPATSSLNRLQCTVDSNIPSLPSPTMPAFATPVTLSRRRLAPLPVPTARPTITLSAAPPRKVFFVLGNAGSGKGTQCALLVDALHLAHISAGDLLRAEVASDSARGREIGAIIADGKIVPGRVTLDLLGAAIDET